MNSFQSTAINVNFFNGTVTSGRFAFGGATTNARIPAPDSGNLSANLDANKVALGRMREALQGQGIQLNPNAQPRSSTDVAEQVLKRISTALDAAPDDAARIALLEKAAEGISQGIAEARQILGQADVLNGKVAETVDAIAEKLQAGLQGLVTNIVSAAQANKDVVPVADNAGTAAAQLNPAPAAGSQASIGAGTLVQRSASISIETQDGDVISLDFNRSAATVVAAEVQAGADGVSASFSAVRVVSSDLSYSVQGELDEDEVEALNELLGNISKVAELGNAETATGNTNNGSAGTTANATPALVEPNADTPSIADAATAVGDVAQVVDLAAQQRVIADPQTAVPNLIETVARAKGFDAPINLAGQSFAEAIGLLRGLVADLVLPASTDDTESGEAKQHDEHGENRDDE